jgi:hypothetical protein
MKILSCLYITAHFAKNLSCLHTFSFFSFLPLNSWSLKDTFDSVVSSNVYVVASSGLNQEGNENHNCFQKLSGTEAMEAAQGLAGC